MIVNISECLNVNAANGCRPWMALAPGAIIATVCPFLDCQSIASTSLAHLRILTSLPALRTRVPSLTVSLADFVSRLPGTVFFCDASARQVKERGPQHQRQPATVARSAEGASDGILQRRSAKQGAKSGMIGALEHQNSHDYVLKSFDYNYIK